MAKAMYKDGTGSTRALLEAMEWMADPDGNPKTDDAPAVVSNSWSSVPGVTTFLKAVKRWVQLGIFPCFAAGNSGPEARTVGVPGGYLESLAVGATDSGDRIARFSARGPVTWNGKDHVKPDVTAPGVSVYSAKPGGSYRTLSGTSMACPHVAGLVALLVQANPAMTIAAIRCALEKTARDLGTQGKDNVFGSGRVDALAAIQWARVARLARLSDPRQRQDWAETLSRRPGPVDLEVTAPSLEASLQDGTLEAVTGEARRDLVRFLRGRAAR